jgi:hypothetical protein
MVYVFMPLGVEAFCGAWSNVLTKTNELKGRYTGICHVYRLGKVDRKFWSLFGDEQLKDRWTLIRKKIGKQSKWVIENRDKVVLSIRKMPSVYLKELNPPKDLLEPNNLISFQYRKKDFAEYDYTTNSYRYPYEQKDVKVAKVDDKYVWGTYINNTDDGIRCFFRNKMKNVQPYLPF